MSHDRNNTGREAAGPSYPIRCIECGKKEVRPHIIRRQVAKNHDGRIYELVIERLPVVMCDSCGEVLFTSESEDHIDDALRGHLGLLSPAEIRGHLRSLKMTQKAAADELGIAPETLSRWLGGGMIQSRAMDKWMRAYFQWASGSNGSEVDGGLVDRESSARRTCRLVADYLKRADDASADQFSELISAMCGESEQAIADSLRQVFALHQLKDRKFAELFAHWLEVYSRLPRAKQRNQLGRIEKTLADLAIE